jgi:hypothetical protein
VGGLVLAQNYKATPELIEQLKEKLPNVKLYKHSIMGDDFIFRQLYPEDWKAIEEFVKANPNMITYDFDEKVVLTALIFPVMAVPEWQTKGAGVIQTLSMHIRHKSGFLIQELMKEEDVQVDVVSPVEPAKRPDPKEIETLKKKASGFQLVGLTIESDYYILRPLTRIEHRNIQAKERADEFLDTAKACVMYPEAVDFDQKPAGYPRVLSDAIYKISGFPVNSEPEEL